MDYIINFIYKNFKLWMLKKKFNTHQKRCLPQGRLKNLSSVEIVLYERNTDCINKTLNQPQTPTTLYGKNQSLIKHLLTTTNIGRMCVVISSTFSSLSVCLHWRCAARFSLSAGSICVRWHGAVHLSLSTRSICVSWCRAARFSMSARNSRPSWHACACVSVRGHAGTGD